MCDHVTAITAAASAAERILLGAVADRWPGEPVSEVDRVSRLLIAAWEQAEHTTVTPSYVASFVDMARVVVADTEARVAAAHADGGLVLCTQTFT